MTILTTTLIVLNILFAVLMLYFMRNLRWRSKPERASIVGFTLLMVTFVWNVIMLGVAK